MGGVFGPMGGLGTGGTGMGVTGMGVTGMGLTGMGVPGMGVTGMGVTGMGVTGMGFPGMGSPTVTPTSLGLPGMMPSGVSTASPAINSDPQFPPLVAFNTAELTCTFYFKKPNPQQPSTTLITAVFASTHPTPISDFNFQAAPPKHAKYTLDFPSGKDLPTAGSTITQLITSSNSAQGEKPLQMKIKVSYTVDGQKRDMEQVLKSFPPNL